MLLRKEGSKGDKQKENNSHWFLFLYKLTFAVMIGLMLLGARLSVSSSRVFCVSRIKARDSQQHSTRQHFYHETDNDE